VVDYWASLSEEEHCYYVQSPPNHEESVQNNYPEQVTECYACSVLLLQLLWSIGNYRLSLPGPSLAPVPNFLVSPSFPPSFSLSLAVCPLAKGKKLLRNFLPYA
jgi:hypothetical protein